MLKQDSKRKLFLQRMDVQCVCIDNPYKENVMFMATVGLLNTISLYQPVELAQCSSEPPL